MSSEQLINQSCSQVKTSIIQSNEMDGLNYKMDGVKHEIDEVNLDISFSKQGKFSFLSVEAEGAHSLHMIEGAKPEIEGVNHDIDGAKCQVVEYFVLQSSQIQSILV